MIVVYWVILYTFVLRYANAEQIELVGNDHVSRWKDAFVFCKNQTLWKHLLNDCQPDTCNAPAVADKIINKSNLGKQQYWIYGYVLRSPVIVNIGCFSLNISQRDTFHRGKFSFQNNSAFECSKACPSTSGYIFLMGTECLCIPKLSFYSMQIIYSDESTNACTTHCQGSIGDLCGGVSSVFGEELYTAYEIVNRYPPGMQHGNSCASVYWDNMDRKYRFSYTRCSTSLSFMCESYNKTSYLYTEECYNETASWYDAREKCHKTNSILTRRFTNRCTRTQHWIGAHVAEKIIWGNYTLPRDALCLTLVIEGSEVRLVTEKCDSELSSLCYTRQSTSKDEHHDASTTIVLSQFNRTTLTVENKNKSTENYVTVITAVFIVLVLCVLVATIAFCIKRRFRQKLYTSVVPAQPQIYSDLNTNPYDEITELDMPQNLDEDGYEMPRSAKITTLG